MHKIYAALLLMGTVQNTVGCEISGGYASSSHLILLLDTNKIIQSSDTLKSPAFSGSLERPGDSLISKITERLKSLHKEKLNYYLTGENVLGVQNFTANKNDFINTASVEGGIRLMGMPFGIEYTNSHYRSGERQFQDNLFRMNFDKGKFVENLPAKPLQLVTTGKERVINAGKEIRSLIAAEFVKAVKTYDPTKGGQYQELIGYISNPHHAMDLLSLNEMELREKLGRIARDKSSALLETEIQKPALNFPAPRTIDSIINRIAEIRSELKKIGLNAEKLKQLENYFSGNKEAELPESLYPATLAGEGISRFKQMLSGIQTLKIGSFGNTIRSSMIHQDILMNGAHLSVFTARGPVTVGYGKNKDLGLIKDAGLDNSIHTMPQKLAYLSIGINNSAYLKGKFTWINSASRGELNERFNVSSLPKNTVGLSVSEILDLHKVGILNFDLSKSASIYKTALEPGTERILEHASLLNDYLFDSSFQTLALGISHRAEIVPWNVSNNFYVNYSGMGYQNPVGTGISPVRFKLGGNLKKKFFNNKMVLNLRTDLRHTPIGSMPGDRWKNLQVQFDSRFRLNRKFNLSLKYMESGMSKEVDNINHTLYSSRKFQLDANAGFRVAKYFSSSHINVAYHNLDNRFSQAGMGNFMNISYSQSLAFGQNSLSGNIFYNKELSPNQFIGDMVNGELCYQYLFGKLNMSTALNYLENTNVTRQYGVRQSFQLVNGKNFDFNASADIRKNLIEPVYPELYPSCRAELSMKYYLSR